MCQGGRVTEVSERLGARIAELRKERGWTQRELAERTGITPTYVSEIENARTKNVGSAILLEIADALGASLDYLLGRRETREEEEPLTVPPNLSEAAAVKGWSYAETRDTLRARKMVVARRTESKRRVRKPEELTAQEWVDFHRRLYDENDDS